MLMCIYGQETHNTFQEIDWLDRVVSVCHDCGTVTHVMIDGAWRSTEIEFDEKGFAIGEDYSHDLLSNDSIAL